MHAMGGSRCDGSDSTLFLKLPEEGLTFIVLANTDLISRNFQACHGDAADVLSSLMALTFYKCFVLAPRYDQPLPVIDWSADSSTVITAISHVEDESVRDFLSKEFAARGAKNDQMPHRFGNAVL